MTLGKEVVSNPVVTADFLVSEGRAQLVSSDMCGNIRIFEFDPLRKPYLLGTSLAMAF